VEQLLYNLVNNAAIHSGVDSEIEVSAGKENNNMVLKVKDNGRGFPSTELKNVFDKFYRLDNTGATGTGLGLSIVKGFTEALGGQVELFSEAGKGSEFIVQVPAETSRPVYYE
jgi:two-component system sensor histidine kinase KdpD